MKVCSKCKVDKDESEFAKESVAKDGLQSRCKKCQKEHKQLTRYRSNELAKIRVAKNSEKYAKQCKDYRKRNLEKEKQRVKNYYYTNHKEMINRARRNNRKNIDNLTDCYIKGQLDVQKHQITTELIEWKRVTIQIKRLIKEKNK